jgi:hypothetical protein
MATSVTKGGTEIAKTFKIVETYWHDHSLDISRGAPADGTISFSIQPFSGDAFSEFFSENLLSVFLI